MRKKRLFLCMLAVVTALSMAACHKKGSKINTLEYSDIMGAAQGTVSFDSDGKLEINIRDIQSYLGVDIDYSSAIEVKNADQFDDFQMWVDATGVDIYTVGKYVATYKFIYDGKETEKNVSVTILEKESSGEDGNSGAGNGNSNGSNASGNADSAGNSNGNGSSNSSAGNGTGSGTNYAGDGNEYWYPEDNDAGSSGNQAAGSDGNSANQENNAGQGNGNSGGNGGNGGQSDGSGNSDGSQNGGSNNGGDNSGDSNNGGQNPSREIITSSQSATKKPSTIGYTNIELLSGKYVKLKCTSAKYIVSTRTDESETEKNGKTYHVSKLVITYNTGAEQVLETVEKAVN